MKALRQQNSVVKNNIIQKENNEDKCKEYKIKQT